ncbi:MAG: 4Fe-4S binding protein [Anaerofustis sp.]
MNRQQIEKIAAELLAQNPGNRMNHSFCAYDAPHIAVASADDPLFDELGSSDVIGDHFRKPDFWLPEARSVISLFFPITDVVKKSNSTDASVPSDEWLYARYEGQNMINTITAALADEIRRSGSNVVIPGLDKRFQSAGSADRGFGTFTSNWSERHIAFIAGHGTFGLSKGLITEYGIAGRFSSLVTDLALAPNRRNYTELYEYCSDCGACIDNCPVHAISFERGKDHSLCSDYLDRMLEQFNPRYACGKCQCGVPCESKKMNN